MQLYYRDDSDIYAYWNYLHVYHSRSIKRKSKGGDLPSHQELWFLASIYLDPGFEPLISSVESEGFIHSVTAFTYIPILLLIHLIYIRANARWLWKDYTANARRFSNNKPSSTRDSQSSYAWIAPALQTFTSRQSHFHMTSLGIMGAQLRALLIPSVPYCCDVWGILGGP